MSAHKKVTPAAKTPIHASEYRSTATPGLTGPPLADSNRMRQVFIASVCPPRIHCQAKYGMRIRKRWPNRTLPLAVMPVAAPIKVYGKTTPTTMTASTISDS